MTPEEAEKAKIRAKRELETFSIYLDQAVDGLGNVLSPQEVFLAAGFAYLGAGQTDIHAAIEGLYEQVQGF
ncbi:TPA: hypothetical protein SVH45_001900 [Streptococcus equi subsp. equi]|uniref:hypothetical protein n=1 Tax=Streptococcus equi TaxID=1336 RepID=UPI00137345D5|nr:hypothetical protein [Streptococcus equi]HEL1128232.1 hypothetical protein [Streptococcus equi subsp. zooepidemicus]MCD3496870.1 hypothetical protein [Streptococcus equi subsp. equi]NBL75886.1 hypothetical protein [Streptococcus equi]NBL81309.1 hypothetical protein [Streptococcus equi]NBL88656.1 hypothetical protein [Streptococcus equi]